MTEENEKGCGKEFFYKGYSIKCGKEQFIDLQIVKEFCPECAKELKN